MRWGKRRKKESKKDGAVEKVLHHTHYEKENCGRTPVEAKGEAHHHKHGHHNTFSGIGEKGGEKKNRKGLPITGIELKKVRGKRLMLGRGATIDFVSLHRLVKGRGALRGEADGSSQPEIFVEKSGKKESHLQESSRRTNWNIIEGQGGGWGGCQKKKGSTAGPIKH